MELIGKKILVVDDEEDVRLFLEDFLGERDLTVMTADCGEHALEKVEENKPDIVLLDLMMPGIDGIETLRRIKAKHPDIIVIMITALKDDAKIAEAKKLGAANYIIKPFRLDYLDNELMRILKESDSEA